MIRSRWTGLLAGGVVGVVVFTAATSLQAQGRRGSSAGDVACLDVIKIFNEYDRQKDLEAEMKVFREEMQDEMERRRGAIDSLQATLDAMSRDDPTYVKRTREMLQLQIDYKNWLDLMQADMAREVGLWTWKIYNEILVVTEELALREGYDMVFYLDQLQLVGYDPETVRDQIRSRKLLYASPAADVTQAVLDRLNANYRAQPKTQMLQVSPTLGP